MTAALDNPRRRHWNPSEDADLAFYWRTTEQVWSIAKRMDRTPGAVYERAKVLGLPRKNGAQQVPRAASPNRGMTAKQIMAQIAAGRPEAIENRDDEHWRMCLAAGGFPYIDFAARVWVWPALGAAE